MLPLLAPFPAPPAAVADAHARLTRPVPGDDAVTEQLDRPWNPAACSPTFRGVLWPWLDSVAIWVNHEYSWLTSRDIVPSCWPLHPHIGHELAVLACLRLGAEQSRTPHDLEEWHRYALPSFCARMADRLGDTCAMGRHRDWPARSRHVEHLSPAAATQRMTAFEQDTRTDPSGPDADSVRALDGLTRRRLDGGSDWAGSTDPHGGWPR